VKKIIPLIFITALSISCSSVPDKKVVDSGNIRAPHGGEILQGDGYFLEVLGSENKVEIYPYKRDDKTGELTAIPLKKIDFEASYSYTYKEDNAGEGRRPTQKGQATIPLYKVGDAMVGEVLADGVAAYSLVIKTDYKNEKERFDYKVDL
jgi:hypothetical protein